MLKIKVNLGIAHIWNFKKVFFTRYCPDVEDYYLGKSTIVAHSRSVAHGPLIHCFGRGWMICHFSNI